MSESPPPRPPASMVSWSERIAYPPGGGQAHRPGELIIHRVDERDDEAVREAIGPLTSPGTDLPTLTPMSGKLTPNHRLVRGKFDPLDAIRALRVKHVAGELSAPFTVQPNHVMFAHTTAESTRTGYPLAADALIGTPFMGNPLYGLPFMGNPYYGMPFMGNPGSGGMALGLPAWMVALLAGLTAGSGAVYGDPALADGVSLPYAQTGRGPNLARPAEAPKLLLGRRGARTGPAVAILDTGLLELDPADVLGDVKLIAERDSPALRDIYRVNPGIRHQHDAVPGWWDDNGDGWIDRVAGHGMFVAGRIAQVLTQGSLSVVQTMTNLGDVDEGDVISRLDQLTGKVDILNLSFGGYSLERMAALEHALQRFQAEACPAARRAKPDLSAADCGPVVVASAGNDASSVAPYPAGLPGVVSVAALGPNGPAAFTNFGPWVRACASGVDVLSTFFRVNSAAPLGPAGDPDDYEGGATWSGTSFAAPLVAGRLAQLMADRGLMPSQAVRELIDAPGLSRLPLLGTIVT